MELNYRYALVSFCPDLTDPDAASWPVALLMIATSADETTATAIGMYPQNNDDPIASALLRDMPRFIRAHVDEVWDADTNADPETLLRGLQHSLRNSVHVSAVSPPINEDVDARTPEELTSAVISKAIAAFFKAMRDSGLYLVGADAAPLARRGGPAVPPMEVWPLSKHAAESQAQPRAN